MNKFKTAKANMPEVPKVKKAAVAKVQKVEMGKINKPMEKKVDSEKNKVFFSIFLNSSVFFSGKKQISQTTARRGRT